MLETHKQKLRHNANLHHSQHRVKNMNSIMHSTSQFDKTGAASTLDQTMSHLHDTSMYTNADLMEQAHNSMNLALGKPTQSFGIHLKNSSQNIPFTMAANSNRKTDPLA